MAKIEWVGTGSGLNPQLGNTSFLVSDLEKNILVDCGFTVTPKLLEKNKLKDVTDVLITHLHSDHVGGLELFGFMQYFVYENKGEKRPRLHLASKDMAKKLWNTLREGMQGGQRYSWDTIDRLSWNNKFIPIDEFTKEKVLYKELKKRKSSISDYFELQIGKTFRINDLDFYFGLTPHVPFMENYSIEIRNEAGKNFFYSGDTISPPPSRKDLDLFFQDCEFGDTGVHAKYALLNQHLPSKIKSKTYLVHLGGGYEKYDPKKDGFAGFVMPGDKFEI